MKPPCFCGRAGRGFGYANPAELNPKRVTACSMRCLSTISKMKTDMAAIVTDIEYEAVQAASEHVGAHLEKLGKTDIATMTGDEWLDFILATYTAVCEQVAELSDVPF